MQLRARGLPYTAEALATLPPFLECPVADGECLCCRLKAAGVTFLCCLRAIRQDSTVWT